MKTLLITSCFLLCFITSSGAQTQLVILAGVSPPSNPYTADLIVNRHLPKDEFLFNMTRVNQQFNAGFRLHIPLSGSFFHEFGMTYSRRTLLFTMAYTYKQLHEKPYREMEEIEKMLQVPATIGVRMGFIDITSGLTGIISLSKDSDLSQMEGYESTAGQFRMGWSTGLRAHLSSIAIGMEFQAELSRIGHGMSVNGESLELRNVPGYVVFTIQFSFQ